MNLGLLMGISKNLGYLIMNLSDILDLEDNKLNYESEKRLLASLENLRTMETIIHSLIMEKNIKLDNEDNF